MLTVPKPHPEEFRDDVVAVDRTGEANKPDKPDAHIRSASV